MIAGADDCRSPILINMDILLCVVYRWLEEMVVQLIKMDR